MVERKNNGEPKQSPPSQTQLISRIVRARKILDTPSIDILDSPELIQKREQALDSFNAAIRTAEDCRYNITTLLKAAEKRIEVSIPSRNRVR